MSEESRVIELPRGGTVVETSIGAIQFGSPPETVKDTMVLPVGVPQIFVMPERFFHPTLGISFAEIEFPIYYNFFLKKRRVTVLCPEDRIESVKVALREAVFGPDDLDVKQDYCPTVPRKYIPDIKSESFYFKGEYSLGDLVDFVAIVDGFARVGSVEITLDPSKNFYTVVDEGVRVAQVSTRIDFASHYVTGEVSNRKFIPPQMGMTCLGSSHGFDPKQNTSGFILWINGAGIMIDPPVTSTEWLERSNVSPKYIDTIILTHCHADHDAGTFQKILAEEKISIYTTQTIMSSFLRKYSALTNIPQKELLLMFHFVPVTIKKLINLHQGQFYFFYSMHSIPTIGFHVNYRGKTLVYSSDHINDPKLAQCMYEKGVISKYRRDELVNFPWHKDVIYHEAGIPPIHTPVSYLMSLPEKVQKKIFIYHIAEKDVPKDSHLTLAQFGIENTNIIKVPEYSYDKLAYVLSVLEKVEFFNSFRLPKIKKLLSILNQEYFAAGATIIKKGSAGTKFYIILSGRVNVQELDVQGEKVYKEYDTFGEAALLLGEKRKASVVAKTDVELMSIQKNDFLNLLEGTTLKSRLVHLSRSRDASTWLLLSESALFRNASSFQKTAFEQILTPYTAQEGECLIENGKTFGSVYMIAAGEIMECEGNGEERLLQRGDLVGNVFGLQKDLPASKTYVAKSEALLYKISKSDILEYIDTYPNMYINLYYAYRT